MCALYNALKHDIGIVTTSYSSGIGLMLHRDAKGKPAWEEFDDEILAQQFFTGAPDAAYRPPQKEIRYIRDDWRAGFGLKYFDSSDPKRYYSSINCDLRFRGKMIPGPLGATVTKPTATYYAPSLTDGGLENWTNNDLDDWTETFTGNGVMTKEAKLDEGDWSARLGNGATAGTAIIHQIITWHTEYKQHFFTFAGSCQATAANIAYVEIDDGPTQTRSSYHVGDSTIDPITVTHQVSASATQLHVIFGLLTANNKFAYFDNMSLTTSYSQATVGVCTADAEFNSKHYKAFGNILAVRTADNFSHVYHFPATITDLQVFKVSGTDYLYIALGDSDELWYMTTAEAFTEAASDEMAYFLTATPSTLYGIKQAGGNALRKTTAVDTWSDDTTTVGHTYDNQTDLEIDEAFNVLVGKTDMPYYISSNVAYPLMPTLKAMKASTSCKNMFTWHGNIYIQAGDQSLFEFDGTLGSATAVKTNISPAHFMSDLDDFNGKIQAITGDDEYLIIVMDDGDDIQILAGRWESVDGSTAWRWHPLAELTLAGCETAFVSSVSKKRLWISSSTAANSVYYFPLTTKYGDIANDTNYRYQQSGEFIDCWLHGNLKGDDKAHYELTATLGHSHDADIYFEVWYQKWGDSGWTDIGDLKGTSSVRTHTLYIPDDSSDAHPVSKFFRVKFIPKTNSTSTAPILESYDIKGAWRPTKRPMIACTIESDEEFILADGQIGKGTITDVKTALDEANAATWPLTFYDIHGSTLTVNVVEMRPEVITVEEVSDQKKRIKQLYHLLLQKVTLS